MDRYHYSLVRFVPDSLRMEPVNVGVVLLGKGQIDFKINTHASRRHNIDTTTFQRWKIFLTTEIHGPAMPLFQPDRATAGFLEYLAKLCTGPIVLTRPLVYSIDASAAFGDVINRLYERLVASPESRDSMEISERPAGRFRGLSKQKQLEPRGLQQHVHVELENNRRWTAYRKAAIDSELVAINKVEVNRQLGVTSTEIELMLRVIDMLPDFVKGRGMDRPTKFYLLADSLERPFTGQSEREFTLMKEDMDRILGAVNDAGGTVVRSPQGVDELVAKLDQMLPPSLA